MSLDNKKWSDKLISKIDPGFKHRWEIYNDIVSKNLTQDTVWVDCGCGNDLMIEEYGYLTKLAVGIDMLVPKVCKGEFIKADIKYLPLQTTSVDLLTLRFVVEHFRCAEPYISEMERVLKSKGHIIIITTNLQSPIIQIPRLLPANVKSKLMNILFKVSEKEIFPAYHKLNTRHKFQKLSKRFQIKYFTYISDLNFIRRWIFIILIIFHIITKNKFLQKFRSNLMVVLQKD
ncbi:MAG: methyltransferase domain-containing protein [Ignavibacteriaceae bacterium]|jgi:SAM-dependent methyltransferase